jgi:hypothetical protein
MIPLGYGVFVHAEQIVALVPLVEGERGQGQRTYVHVEGLDEPLVASRSERAILADMEHVLKGREASHGRRLLGGRLRQGRRAEPR